jgi:hypothetical protein
MELMCKSKEHWLKYRIWNEWTEKQCGGLFDTTVKAQKWTPSIKKRFWVKVWLSFKDESDMQLYRKTCSCHLAKRNGPIRCSLFSEKPLSNKWKESHIIDSPL